MVPFSMEAALPSSYTPNANLELQANGENTDTWGIRLNNNTTTPIDSVLGGVLPLSLSNSNISLTTTQTQNNCIVLTGTLTANVAIIFPQIGRNYFVVNSTTGAFSVTLKTSAVSGVVYVIPQGQNRYVTLNGTDVLVGQNGMGAQSSIASAATTDLGTIQTRNALITGATPITSFGSNASVNSPIYQVTFAAALTLTYNATSLITPSAGNIYTQAGDTAVVLYLGSGNWQVLSYSANTYIPGVQSIAGGFKNLVITVTGNSTATITADALTLEDASGRAYRAKNVNLTLNLASTGANGLDTGSETASTWYSLWVIFNQANSTLACLASISATSPTLPAGYTYQARFGWLRNDASSNLWRTIQKGNHAHIVVGTNPTGSPIIASGTAGSPTTPTWVALSISSFVPPTASTICLGIVATIQTSDNTGAMVAPNNSYGAYSSLTNPPPLVWYWLQGWQRANSRFDMDLESINIYWASSASNIEITNLGWNDNL